MNMVNIGGYTRINKKAAERVYNHGGTVRVCACNMSPVNVWGAFVDVRADSFAPIAGDGYSTVVPRSRDWEKVVNAFRYYSCNHEAGRYPAYYIREGMQG